MSFRNAVVVLAFASVAGPAWAQAETQVDTYPDWLRKPSRNDLMAVWPHEMLKQGKGGQAVIHCKVSRQGALYGCQVVSEKPAGSGFGTAGIALTPQFLMKPATKGGAPVAYDGVTIPLNFNAEGMSTDGSADFGSRAVVTFSHWVAAPSYAQTVAAYPAKAREKHVGGRVTLSCNIKADGRLAGCHSLTEEPARLGLADAARSLAQLFVAPPTVKDQPTKGMITQVPFTFTPEMLDGQTPTVGKPRWVAVPTVEQLNAGMPPADPRAGPVSVRVVLACTVMESGKVDACAVEQETPPGRGYGEAALAVSKYFALSNWTAEGLPTIGGRVRIPIRYEFAAPAASAPAKP